MAEPRPNPDATERIAAASKAGSAFDPEETQHLAPSDVATGLAGGQRVFGRYTLEAEIGRGGMGVVWRARDEELGESIALKFLPSVIARDAATVDELKDETRRARRLTHANVVRIHDFVRDATMAAVSMELVDGVTLSHRRIAQPGKIFSAGTLAPLVKQICAALECAHTQAKIVHRDLKPANILVTADGVVKITDFGISRSLAETNTRLTGKSAGGTSGTLPYMSPQQLLGRKPTAADDIYALGATLYELLTSKPPFHRGEMVTLMLQIREAAPLPLAEQRAELEVTGAPIPPEWEATILACLAKEPGQRPASAAEVAARLAASVSAVPSGEAAGSAEEALLCPACGRATRETARHCPHCGKNLTEACPECEARNRSGSRFCEGCGVDLPAWQALATKIGKAEQVLAQGELDAAQAILAEIHPNAGMLKPEGKSGFAARLTELRRRTEAAVAEAAAKATKDAEERAEQVRKAEQEQRERARREAEKKERAQAEEKRRLQKEAEVAAERETAEAKQAKKAAPSLEPPRRPAASAAPRRKNFAVIGAVLAAVAMAVGYYVGVSLPKQRAEEAANREAAQTEAAQRETAKRDAAQRETVRREWEVQRPLRDSGQPWTIPGLGLTMMPIAAGLFTMGSENGGSDEKPQTRVTLTKPFWLGKTEVTQREWVGVMGNNPSNFKGETLPVENVSWTEAMAFCTKLTERERAAGRLPEGYAYTLPTEAQWEYACRAGTTSDYAGELDTMAWFSTNSGNTTNAVATKRANAWGLYDMHGNVYEWCADWYGNHPGGSLRDPVGPASGSNRVARGGCWDFVAVGCRSAVRHRFVAGIRNRFLGFRLCLGPQVSP